MWSVHAAREAAYVLEGGAHSLVATTPASDEAVGEHRVLTAFGVSVAADRAMLGAATWVVVIVTVLLTLSLAFFDLMLVSIFDFVFAAKG